MRQIIQSQPQASPGLPATNAGPTPGGVTLLENQMAALEKYLSNAYDVKTWLEVIHRHLDGLEQAVLDHNSKATSTTAEPPSPTPSNSNPHPSVHWAIPITAHKAFLTLTVQGHSIKGQVDTSADVSVLCPQDVRPSWTLQPGPLVQGVGGLQQSQHINTPLSWSDPDGKSGTFCPLVIANLAHSLWGRDILPISGAILTIQTPPQF